MKSSDDELQNQFDQGNYTADGIDGQAYQKVYSALKREPDYTLPVYFADRLLSRIESEEKVKETSRDNWWLGLGLLSFVIVLIVSLVLTDFQPSAGAFQFLAGHAGLISFGLGFILLLNWIDKKVIRKVRAFEIFPLK